MTITVKGTQPYDVVVGTDLAGRLPALVGSAGRVAIIHQAPLRALADRLAAVLPGHEILRIELPDGEAAKTLAVAGMCWDRLGTAGFTRSDVIVGLGGGAATDLAGWVAASWLRGVTVIQVPTTLLGMVDAALGGKTGINTAAGKNLVGAFHPPAGVLCDLSSLPTLPGADYRAGLAEIVKAGFIADPVILELIEADPTAALSPAGPHTQELITRSIQVKADVVGEDLTEKGLREILNYGHTLGHAIERAEGYRWRHGEAVSVGMIFAAELGLAAGRLDAEVVDRHRRILAELGLPMSYPAAAWPALHDAMRVDKKSRGSRLRFIVLDGLARPGILEDPSDAVLEQAYGRIAQ
ncbi:MAG TPA: 3-dehydroquinate synthase [Mycobacteriales bacterium]|nr:3-dehydroquinate synthase [Mycobacteriales bacterium]